MNKPKHIAFTARGSFMGIGWCPPSIPSAKPQLVACPSSTAAALSLR